MRRNFWRFWPLIGKGAQEVEQLKQRYAVVGIGTTKQGKVPGRGALSFHVEACANALQDAGLPPKAVDGLLLYRHFAPVGGDLDVSAFMAAEQLGIRPTALSQETYCTRGWITHAIGLLEAGFCNYVLISYGDNARSGHRSFVRELERGEATDALAAYGDFSTLAKYAMIARRAMYETGTGSEVWKNIALCQRQFANLNPEAAMHEKVLTEADYYASPYVVEPFRLLDATPTTDGGRAILITSAERAKDLAKSPAYILGIGEANQPKSPGNMSLEDSRYAPMASSTMAFRMAGVTTKDIDACEIYDCFTYTVEATLRDYGFFAWGESADFFVPARIGPGGSLPINTSGGMLSEGYFMGLTPVVEAVRQLRGECGDRQLGVFPGSNSPKLILCSDNGGVLQSHATLILGKEG